MIEWVQMGLFRKKNHGPAKSNPDAAALALRSLDFIAEGVLVVDYRGMIKFANPAAAAMTGFNDPSNITGLDFQLVIHLENSQGTPIESNQSELYTAIMLNRTLNTRDYVLISAQSERRIAIDLTCISTGDERADRVVTFRDITKELAEEKEQAEFVSTASHEMRTPVASIEGYLGLSLNPQTATIDDRAKKYLEAAHAASQHLGRLFKDLLDVTKFDDDRAKAHLVPVDAIEAVAYVANEQAEAMQAKHLRYSFGGNRSTDKKHLSQKIYMAVDYDFFREIINNLVGNAIKYTPEGGEIKVNVKGDGDKVIISVADTGIGIPADDLGHIFQKFYRVDSTQTREIGGTGLGLYLVKQRVEALGGRVWAESVFGHGSTFYVSLPRISESEYERMRIAYGNEKMVRTPFVAPVVGTAAVAAPSASVTRTVTTPPAAKIQPAQAASPMPADATPADGNSATNDSSISAPATAPAVEANGGSTPTIKPISAVPASTPTSPSTAKPTSQPAATTTPSTTPNVPHSNMIQSRKVLPTDAPSESPPSDSSASEPQIFERKATTLMPPQANPNLPNNTNQPKE